MLQRVHLDIQVGEHANNYAEIAAKDKLTELQLRVRQLVEQVDQIQKEQNYQRVSIRWCQCGGVLCSECSSPAESLFVEIKMDEAGFINYEINCNSSPLFNNFDLTCVCLSVQYREERFRQTSESTNQRVLWWSIVQTIILVAIGIWQMRHLKSFFEAKKLV